MTRDERPGFDPALYDADFFVWTQRQAAALRAMPHDPAVDIDRVAEEIEDLGKRDLREVSSFLARLVEHLIKIEAYPSSCDKAHWATEAVHFQFSAVAAFTPGMRRLLNERKVWARGRKLASVALRGVKAIESSSECPLELDELLAEDFDVDAAVARLSSLRDKRAGKP